MNAECVHAGDGMGINACSIKRANTRMSIRILSESSWDV